MWQEWAIWRLDEGGHKYPVKLQKRDEIGTWSRDPKASFAIVFETDDLIILRGAPTMWLWVREDE